MFVIVSDRYVSHCSLILSQARTSAALGILSHGCDLACHITTGGRPMERACRGGPCVGVSCGYPACARGAPAAQHVHLPRCVVPTLGWCVCTLGWWLLLHMLTRGV